MLNTAIIIDGFITKLITDIIPRSYFTDLFFSFLSLQGVWFFVWLIVIAFYIEWEERKHHYFTLYFFVNFVLTSFVVQFILKNVIERQRPWLTGNVNIYGCPSDYSFPSSHAALAWSSAYICSRYDKKRSYYYYCLAVLISLSRIYLHCHYFLDVVAGSLIGLATAGILLKIRMESLKKIR